MLPGGYLSRQPLALYSFGPDARCPCWCHVIHILTTCFFLVDLAILFKHDVIDSLRNLYHLADQLLGKILLDSWSFDVSFVLCPGAGNIFP